MSTVTFEALPLVAELQRALSDNGYTEPSPIQAQAIPGLVEGRDFLGSAQTGTGKTAAFCLPILNRLVKEPKGLRRHHTRALILTPTRELAVQVAANLEKYGRHIRFRSATIYGGVRQFSQVKELRKGLDVLVATPGRLLDLMEQGHLRLDDVETFVLDEADRMLDMGFLPDIRRVVQELPEKRQTIFLSATISPEIERLAGGLLTDPFSVRIAPETTTAENVEHAVCFVARDNKPQLLREMVGKQLDSGDGLVLVFSKTRHGADRLARDLGASGFEADAIHGDKSQNARERTLRRFRDGRTAVLVATDVAARGIDVKNIGLVINYDLPMEPEAYVHRIGRTARAGASGIAYSFCAEGEYGLLRGIERNLGKSILVNSDHSFHAEGLASGYSSRGGGRGRGQQGFGKSKGGFRKFRGNGGGFRDRNREGGSGYGDGNRFQSAGDRPRYENRRGSGNSGDSWGASRGPAAPGFQHGGSGKSRPKPAFRENKPYRSNRQAHA